MNYQRSINELKTLEAQALGRLEARCLSDAAACIAELQQRLHVMHLRACSAESIARQHGASIGSPAEAEAVRTGKPWPPPASEL